MRSSAPSKKSTVSFFTKPLQACFPSIPKRGRNAAPSHRALSSTRHKSWIWSPLLSRTNPATGLHPRESARECRELCTASPRPIRLHTKSTWCGSRLTTTTRTRARSTRALPRSRLAPSTPMPKATSFPSTSEQCTDRWLIPTLYF